MALPEASFIWGSNGAKLTPEEIAMQRAILARKGGIDTSPVGHWTQGAARVADAIAGAFQRGSLDKAEAAGQAEASSLASGIDWGSLTGGATGGGDNRYTAADTSAAPTASTGARSGSTNVKDPQIFDSFINTVKEGGVTNPSALAAIAATGQHESGYSAKNVYGSWADPSESGRALTAGGVMSWNGPRYEAMKRFVAANGGDPNKPDPTLQAKYFLQEDPALVASLNAAKTPEEAQTLMNNAWRFAGYNRPGGEAARRISSARQFAGRFAGSTAAPVQTASLDPSIGMNGDGANPLLPNIPAAEMTRTTPSIPMPADQMQPMGGLTEQAPPVGVGAIPAGAGGQPVLDVTQVPQLSEAAGLPFQGAPQASPGVQTVSAALGAPQGAPQASPAVSRVSDAMLRANDQALGGIMAPEGTPQPANAALGGYFPAAPDANRPDFPAQSQEFPPAPQDNPQAQVQQLVSVINHPFASREQKMMAMQALEQVQKQNDPANRLDIQYKQAQIDALTNKPKEAPKIETLYDASGNEYKAQWNPVTQQYDRIGGSKSGLLTPEEFQQKKDLAAAGASKTNINTGTNTSDFQKKSDELAATRLNDIVAGANSAPQIINDLNTLTELGKKIGTGNGAAVVQALGPYAASFGIDVKGLDEGQAFESIIQRMAPQMRPVGAGSSSDRDIAGYLKSLPAIANQPGGNELIARTFQAVQENKIKAADIASKAQSGEITWQQAEQQIRSMRDDPWDEYKKFKSDLDDPKKVPTTVKGVTIEKLSD